jgi:hypothetical protein
VAIRPVTGVRGGSVSEEAQMRSRPGCARSAIEHLGRGEPRDEFVFPSWRRVARCGEGDGSGARMLRREPKRRGGADISNVRSPSSLGRNAASEHPSQNPKTRLTNQLPIPAIGT